MLEADDSRVSFFMEELFRGEFSVFDTGDLERLKTGSVSLEVDSVAVCFRVVGVKDDLKVGHDEIFCLAEVMKPESVNEEFSAS